MQETRILNIFVNILFSEINVFVCIKICHICDSCDMSFQMNPTILIYIISIYKKYVVRNIKGC